MPELSSVKWLATFRYCAGSTVPTMSKNSMMVLPGLKHSGAPGSCDKVLSATQPLYGLASILSEKWENSSLCYKELGNFKRAVDANRNWGLKVLDVSGRPTSGFLYGNALWIGNHAECMDLSNTRPLEVRHDKIAQAKTPYDYPPFDLAFASLLLQHNSTLQIHLRQPLELFIQLGLCIPKSCTEDEIRILSELYFDQKILELQRIHNLNISVKEVRILREDMFWLLKLPKTIVLLILMGSVLFLTIIGTIVDVKHHNLEKRFLYSRNVSLCNNEYTGKATKVSSVQLVDVSSSDLILNETQLPEMSNTAQLLKCFSFYSNVKNFCSTKLGSDDVTVIHGLRFGGMCWVILVHTTYYQGDFATNAPYVFRLTEQFFAQIVSNSTYCVDTFLLLSGFLLGYILFKRMNPHNTQTKRGTWVANLNLFVTMFTNRFFRLTPTYVIVILLCSVLHTYYSHWSSLITYEKPEVTCDQFWWRNLLYVNNLYPRKEMCLSWSWYLSLDTQFFTVGSFLIILSAMYFKLSATILFGLILASIFATVYKSYAIEYIPTLDDQRASLDALYDLPWNRIGPYLVGIITAYILVIRLNNQLVLSKRTKLLLWTFFPLLNLWVLFTLYTRQIGVTFSAVYMGVSRTLWGVGIAWIIVACSTKNARFLENILSFKGFIPLSRLTYCAYLLNPLVVYMVGLGSEVGIAGSIPGFAVNALGVFMITFMLSFLFSMIFESPFILLTKMALNKISKSKEKNNVKQNGEKGEPVENKNGSCSETA